MVYLWLIWGSAEGHCRSLERPLLGALDAPKGMQVSGGEKACSKVCSLARSVLT